MSTSDYAIAAGMAFVTVSGALYIALRLVGLL